MTAITKGAEGSVVVKDGAEIHADAEKITPVDTNGAGDMFAGSFMHAYFKTMIYRLVQSLVILHHPKLLKLLGPD